MPIRESVFVQYGQLLVSMNEAPITSTNDHITGYKQEFLSSSQPGPVNLRGHSLCYSGLVGSFVNKGKNCFAAQTCDWPTAALVILVMKSQCV